MFAYKANQLSSCNSNTVWPEAIHSKLFYNQLVWMLPFLPGTQHQPWSVSMTSCMQPSRCQSHFLHSSCFKKFSRRQCFQPSYEATVRIKYRLATANELFQQQFIKCQGLLIYFIMHQITEFLDKFIALVLFSKIFFIPKQNWQCVLK